MSSDNLLFASAKGTEITLLFIEANRKTSSRLV